MRLVTTVGPKNEDRALSHPVFTTARTLSYLLERAIDFKIFRRFRTLGFS
jgi:hypothetical protein